MATTHYVPKRSPGVVMMAGKHGRHNMKLPFNELLEVEETLRTEVDTMRDDDIDRIATKVRDLAARNQGHRFDTEYVEAYSGAYGISCIVIDTDFNVSPIIWELFRPTAPGGHVAFRSRENLTEILEFTYKDLTPKEADGEDLKLVLAASADAETVILGPESLTQHPKLLRAMGLKTMSGDPEDDVVAFYVRLCDGKGLGKSAPRICHGKFKFLFPGVAIDTTQVKSRKRTHAETVPPPPPAPVAPTGVKKKLRTIVKNEYLMNGGGRSLLHCVANKFLITLGETIGDDAVFDEKMGAYLNLDPDVMIPMFSNIRMCQTVAKAALSDDPEKVAAVVRSVREYHADMSKNN